MTLRAHSLPRLAPLCAIASLFVCSSLFAQEQVAQEQVAQEQVAQEQAAQEPATQETRSQEQPTASSGAAAVLDSMPHAQKIDEAALSPDGNQVAYLVDGRITVTPARGGVPRAIAVEENLPLRDLAWSADSKTLAFLADLPGDAPSAQVWTVGANGSAPVKRAELKGYAQLPTFSPDGTRLALLFIEGMPRVAGPLQPMTPLAGVVDQKIFEQRIATINLRKNDLRENDLRKNDLRTNHFTQVTPLDMYVYEYDWIPDGSGWVVSAAHGSGDANWWVARLYHVNAQTGEMREIYRPKLQIADPRVSPDGKNVAFIEGLMSDQGFTGGDVYLVAMTGGEARNLTPGIKASASLVEWTAPGHITFAENVDGNAGFGSVNEDGSALKLLWTGEEAAHPASDAWTAGKAGDASDTAIIRQSASAPPEVWVGPIGNWKLISSVNAGLKPEWGEMRNVHWMNGPTRVQGWLMFPKDFSPGKKFPLVIQVHGGPSSLCDSHWDETWMGPVSAMGYFALCPNPRGSYGQGEAFTQANVKDFGGGDYRDIMAGVDAISREYPIDPKRIGIRGHSYGGYMTMWAETQTKRFAAAVAGAGLSDWLSYYGLNDIDEWMIPFFGASVYDDPAVYAKSDPMHFVKAVTTPTLILVGERDGEVPMEQSVEWWHALTTLRVPAKLVVYPNEGHMFVKPSDTRDYSLRSLEWFEEWFAKAR